jgi:hypothetical protein
VVVIVSVAEPLAAVELELKLKLQELCEGRPEHTAEFSGIVPLKPFITYRRGTVIILGEMRWRTAKMS